MNLILACLLAVSAFATDYGNSPKQPVIQSSGAFVVTPGTGVWNTAPTTSITVTPGTGTFISQITTGSISAFQAGPYVVTAGTGTWSVHQSTLPDGSYTVTPGTGIWSTSGSTNTVYQEQHSTWSFNLSSVNGSSPSITNPIPVRLTNGNSYISTFQNGNDRYLDVGIKQEVVASTTNITSSNLNALAQYVGGAESTLGINAIQVNAIADQPLSIFVQQSSDSINWDITDKFLVKTGTGSAFTVQATGSYYRVIVRNQGSATTTYLRMSVALCPIVEALPRALTNEGNLKTAIVEPFYDSTTDSFARITPMSRMVVAEPKRLAGVAFSTGASGLDPTFWISTNSMSGSTSTVGGQLTLRTGTVANSSSTVRSFRVARYISGTNNNGRFVVRFPDTGAANNRRLFGVGDESNGFFFDLNGTEFGVISRKDGVDTKVTVFNGWYGQEYPSLTSARTYEISYTNSRAIFMINGRLLHSMSGASTTLSSTLHFPLYARNENSNGGTSDLSLEIRNMSIYRMGSSESNGIYRNKPSGALTTTLKQGLGTLKSVTIGTAGNGTCSIQDGLNVISLINSNAFTGQIVYNIDFYTNLNVVCGAGSGDFTFVFD